MLQETRTSRTDGVILRRYSALNHESIGLPALLSAHCEMLMPSNGRWAAGATTYLSFEPRPSFKDRKPKAYRRDAMSWMLQYLDGRGTWQDSLEYVLK